MRWDGTERRKRYRIGEGFKLVPKAVPKPKPEHTLEQRVLDLFIKSHYKSARVDVDADWKSLGSFQSFAGKLRKEIMKRDLLGKVAVIVQSVDFPQEKRTEHQLYLVRKEGSKPNVK